MSILSARQLHKSYGPQTLFDGIALTIREGDRIGLLGTNGTGKSTFLRVLAGVETADTGTIDRSRDARVLYLPQEPELDPTSTPRAIVLAGLHDWHAAKSRHDEVSLALADARESSRDAMALATEQAKLADEIERLGGWERGHLALEMLTKLGVLDLDRPIGSMSGGEKRRTALARLFVASPTLAILDEPTNHLDTDTIEWLEEYLVTEFRGAVLLVTHDRYVLDAVATRIIELDRGKLDEYIGNYGDFLEQKEERLAQEHRTERNRLNFVRREREWLSRGPKARTTKQKARIDRAEAAIAIQAPKERARAQIEGHATRLGKSILEFKDVSLEMPPNEESKGRPRRLIEGLSFHLVGGDRIGIVGPNGVGKTTLLKLVTGDLAPTSGAVVRGTNTKIAYFDQSRMALEDSWSIYDNVAGREGSERTGGGQIILGDRTIDLRVYLEQFLFEPSKQRQKVGSLSGGERARVALAMTLSGSGPASEGRTQVDPNAPAGANLLLLDEPTNDLDVATLGALEEMLESWNGCAIVVSHDRYFLNRVATSILAFNPNAEASKKTIVYAGNYESYRSMREAGIVPAQANDRPKENTAKTPAKIEKTKDALTYAERIEFDKILDRVSEAEDLVASIEKELADPTLYVSRATEAPALQKKLEDAQKEAHRLTARWEALEAKRSS